jgi:23S rRNA (pseudouridine1915-N3)-methyltransferase
MMRLRIIWIGKTKDAHLRALIEMYLKRLERFVSCQVSELREGAGADSKAGIERESKRISDALRTGTITVLLDCQGAQWTSEQLAEQVRSWNNNGTKEVTFIVGGALGIAAGFAADKHWSLSRLTFTHEMARVLLVEQLYRAYTIVHGLPYQK